jgi:hypothetical protein
MSKAFFDLPLNLPHAATVASRILYHLNRVQQVNPGKADAALAVAMELTELLRPYKLMDDNPREDEAKQAVTDAAKIGRTLVDAIERGGVGDDRLGQTIRNLFECLAMGQEGAQLSLRAGENPGSALRAV